MRVYGVDFRNTSDEVSSDFPNVETIILCIISYHIYSTKSWGFGGWRRRRNYLLYYLLDVSKYIMYMNYGNSLLYLFTVSFKKAKFG